MEKTEKRTGARRKTGNRTNIQEKRTNTTRHTQRENFDSRRLEESRNRAKLNIVNTCPEDIMNESKRKIGIAPITADNIRDWVEDEDSQENDQDTKLFKANSHHIPRMNAAVMILEEKLKNPMSEIVLIDAKICREPEKGIMWLECSESFVKRIFYKASILQDPTIRTIQYTPHETFKRKIAIDGILKEMREKEVNLKTQVRPGNDDWEVRLKKASKYEYDSWDVLTVEDIDPEGKVPPMQIKYKKDDPKVKEFLKVKTKEVDEEGFETFISKNK